jgi:hypothetical protein
LIEGPCLNATEELSSHLHKHRGPDDGCFLSANRKRIVKRIFDESLRVTAQSW